MKKLSELYKNIKNDTMINGIQINSKEIKPGDLFICTMGVTADRHDFIDDAINHGASAIVVSKDVGKKDVPIVKVDNTNKELPLLCQRFYDYPDKKMKMIGVTGTDGKTSVATIIQTLIGDEDCGYIGTNGRSCKGFSGDNPNTTPDAHKLYKYLNEFVSHKCKYTVMETSSEAFFRGRLQDMEYDVSVFTNISREHLNIHGTLENYVESKSKLFKQTKKDGYCILNSDDEHFPKMKNSSNGTILTYGKSKDSTLQIVDYKLFPNKTKIVYNYKGVDYNIESPLLADFNVYNLAAALLACISLGFKLDDLIKNIKNIKVSGRMEFLKVNGDYNVIVDYAHTPNGIYNMLNFVNKLNFNKIIVVIGSAGERDRLKRPIMGKTVCDNADYAIFTSEDPRSEDPLDIAKMLASGVDGNNYEIEVDRKKAITKAINMAKDNDAVLILGKGNETTQKMKNGEVPFNDIEEAYIAIKNRGN